MFSTMDVYDAASSIGRECQLIMGEYGIQVLENIMPKLINILEELETCSTYFEKEKDEIIKLQSNVNELKEDQKSQIAMRMNYYKSLEQLEQSWYCETQNLIKQASELEQENDQLTKQLIKIYEHQGHTDLIDSITNHKNKHIESKSASNILLTAAKLKPAMESCATTTETKPKGSPTRVAATTQRQSKSEPDLLPELMCDLLLETEERLKLTQQESQSADLQLIKQLKECAGQNYKIIRQLHREMMETSAELDTTEDTVCKLARQSGNLMAECAPHRRETGQLAAEKARLEAQLCLLESELSKLNTGFDTLLANDKANTDVLQLSAGIGLEALHISSVNNGDGDGTSKSSAILSLEELRYLLHERNELRCHLLELEEQLKTIEIKNKLMNNDEVLEGPIPREPIEKLRPNCIQHTTIKSIFHDLLHCLTKKSLE